MIRPLMSLAAVVLAAATLGACGKQGSLDRPAPLWGARARADYAAQKRAQAEARQKETQSNQVETPPEQGPGTNPFANPAPPRAQPIPGEAPSPTAPGAQGAMPNPYVEPQ
ncbi:MAG TPA: hypothetical protein VMU93_10940 [Caulobacteraceae bacterium]|nr:hypothetical protein [Caulobacteraceae bacterium]